MPSIKIARINHIIQEDVSMIIMKEVKDSDVKAVTITGVDTTADLSFAKIYYTVLNEEQKEATAKALEKAAPFIRTKLAEMMEIRHTPELVFKYDTSIAYGEHIERIINKIHDK